MEKRVTTNFRNRKHVFRVELSPDSDGETSIDQKVFLEFCENPTKAEEKLISDKTCLHHHHREWLPGVEKKEYTSLCHSLLLKSVENHPGGHLYPQLQIPYGDRF